ncbi:MAG: NAD kinase [Saprospiraceae bacterium]
MQALIFGREYKEKDRVYIQALFDALHDEGAVPFIFTPYLDDLKKHIRFKGDYRAFDDHSEFKNHRITVVIVLGGDGSMLQAITLVRDSGAPMLGINLGRLGFLASTEKNKIAQAVRCLSRNQYSIEERSMLYLESTPSLFGDFPIALNDFTLLKRDTSSMITVRAYLNGDFLNAYWADGVIVATPTGSTGYSLSCGGPLIFPDSANLVLTPVAPHHLNVRPIVFSDESVISFEIEGRTENYICTLDSRFELIGAHHQLAVRKNNYPIRLIRLHDASFLRTIREKMAWGSDFRN